VLYIISSADTAISAYRRIDYWWNTATGVLRGGATVFGVKYWDRFADNTINAPTYPPAGITTEINLSTFIPDGFISEILYGGRSSSQNSVVALSGISGTPQTTLTAGPGTDAIDEFSWFAGTTGWVQNVDEKLYWGDGNYNQSSITVQLAIHAVKLRR
jgi:hypothetical protein